MKKQVKKQMKKQYMPAVIVCVLILLLAAAGVGIHVVKKYIPTKERMDLNEYYGKTAEGESVIVLGTEIMEERAVTSDDQTYLPLEFVSGHLNQRYYWDSSNQQILYATPSELQMYPASQNGDGDVWLKDGSVFLSLPFVQKYTDMDVYMGENPSRIIIQNQFTGVNVATAKKDTYVRYRGGIKSPILTEVKKGDTLTFMEEYEEWVQVATMDGYIGFVKKKDVSSPEAKDFERDFQKEEYQHLAMEEPVNLSWHQVTSEESNTYFTDAVANVSGVNVISPTWFYLQDTQGNIADISSADYVKQAHDKGMKVWGLIDNFTADVSTTDTLSQLSSRQNIISQLMSAAEKTGLDGINVDFETVAEKTGEHYIQFIRELSVECRKNNIVLSVDNYVPKGYNTHYNRKEQGIVADYVIIMGYDEHFAGSYESGSVASIDYVKEGIKETLKDVPAEKVINAMPLYTRLWKEVPKTEEELAEEAGTEAAEYPVKVTSETYAMNKARQVAEAAGAKFTWDDKTKQNYAQWEADGATYKMWLEDEKSLEEKLKVMKENKLAGTAVWKLGFENASVWELILKYVN